MGEVIRIEEYKERKCKEVHEKARDKFSKDLEAYDRETIVTVTDWLKKYFIQEEEDSE